MKIIQTGDLHIDTSYYGGINPATGIDREWESNVRAITSAVDAAIENDIDAFIVAGDMFRNGRPTSEAILLLGECLRPLVQARIPIILLRGNHELILVSAGQRSATVLLGEMLSGMDPDAEVHVVEREPRLVTTTTGVQAVCLPWLSKSTVLTGRDDTKGLDPAQTDALVVSEAFNHIEQLTSQADDGAPLFFFSHVTVDDVRLDSETGLAMRGAERDMAHLFAEPILPREQLEEFGFTYGGLSHIHARNKLSPTIYYPGSTNRHTLSDADREKSVNLVTVNTRGRMKVEYVPVDARPMTRIDMNTDEARDLLDLLPDGALVELVLEEGQTETDKVVASKVAEAGGRIVRVRKPQVAQPKRPTATFLSEQVSPMSALNTWLDGRTDDEAQTRRVLDLAEQIIDARPDTERGAA